MTESNGPYAHFRLNFEQQGKRAKDLLKAAKAGDAAALARFTTRPPKLAEAQFLIARELRFDNWVHLKRHITAMARERAAAAQGGAAILDADLRTLHIRCGSDIRTTLQSAGFHGDFYEHSHPYSSDPVPADLPDFASYDRVVIWSEGDVHDQLVLVRLLAHYATHARPPHLELVNSGDFPGGTRFIGLGQLPPEALRLLWAERDAVTAPQLVLGAGAWRALMSPDPRALAAIMRGGTPALPLLAPALHRHLRELPDARAGLSLTQTLVLEALAGQDLSLNRLFGRLNVVTDPLPGQGDLQMRDRVLPMGEVREPLFTRRPGVDSSGNARPPWTDVLTITDLGRAVLRGEADFQNLKPRPRWVGGVRIAAGEPDWRWDEQQRDAIRR